MSRDQVAGKLRDVAGSARRPLDPLAIERLIEATLAGEDVADVSVLPALASEARR